jgi:2-polyprenyl-3-methyl-5-hydroxy-6-metoxy-1,4-benzoquinol methylase
VTEPETRFQRALLEHLSSGAVAQNDALLHYALSTNERGAQVVAKVQEFTPSLLGLRFLDIGSGYGGVCAAAARAGAEAVGLEANASNRRLAELNVADAPELSVRFIDADVMDWRPLSTLGRFDVITCDNVIEHVASPPVLVAHARRLLEPNGLLYLTAPNVFSFGQITKEWHGLSVLDPVDGTVWVRERLTLPSYGVSVYLRSLLARYGLHAKLLNPVGSADEEVERVRAARREAARTRAAAIVPASLRAKADHFLNLQLACCDADLAFFDAMAPGPARELFGHELALVYLMELWYVVASPSARRLDASLTRREPAVTLGAAGRAWRTAPYRVARAIARITFRKLPGPDIAEP